MHALFDSALQTLFKYINHSCLHGEAENDIEKSNNYFSVIYLELKPIESD